MARPNKKGLDYFPFDVDFFSDEKIGSISGEFGIKGEITAIKLLCAIYRNGYFILWNDALKMSLLRGLPGISLELLEQIVTRLVRWGFFEQTLFSTVSVLTSKGIQERYFEAIKRRKDSSNYPYLLVNVDNNRVNVDNNGINVNINPIKESKVKKKKELLSSESNKKNEPKGFPLTQSHPGFNPDLVDKPLDECKKILEANIAWIETVCMQQYISTSQFKDYLDEFFKDMACRDVGMKSPKDARSHFASWLKINLRIKSNENSNGTRKQDRDTDRKSRLAGYFQDAFSDCGKGD